MATGILDEDEEDDNDGLEMYLEAITTTESVSVPADPGSVPTESEPVPAESESMASLYYPLYGEQEGEQDGEQEQEDGGSSSSSNENSFVIFLGFLGSVFPTKKFCRSLSGIGYVAKTCILLDIIKRARTRRVSLREAEDPSIVDAGLYGLLTLARTHYIHLGLSLARSEGNLFRLNLTTGDIYNSENAVVGHKNMMRTVFDRLYKLAKSFVLEVSQGEEFDYSVDNARLIDGMVHRRHGSPRVSGYRCTLGISSGSLNCITTT